MNTILDVGGAEGRDGPAFEFGTTSTVGSRVIEHTGVGCFIDSVTIVGAFPSETRNDYWVGAGIWLGGEIAARPTISNCWFVRNYVGIGIGASPEKSNGVPVVVHDGTTIVNNTFAFNVAGIWNGVHFTGSSPWLKSDVGWSKLIIVNNVFDANAPETGTAPQAQGVYPWMWNPDNTLRRFNVGADAFVGVGWADLRIQVGVSPPTYVDFNAYEAGNYNVQLRPAANWPLTGLRSGTVTPASPGIDIAPYTGYANTPNDNRGVLFVRDLLCHAYLSGSIPGLPIPNLASNAFWPFDASPMDLRLSPAVIASSGSAGTYPPPGGPGGLLNPLVDRGWSGSFPVAMENGVSWDRPPGYLPLTSGQNAWEYDNWDFDCEGFGNPRGADHPSYANGSYTGEHGAIDIGADELSELPIAGYRHGTRLFVRTPSSQHPVTGMGYAPDNRYLWYLGPPASLTSAPPHPQRPMYRAYAALFNNPSPPPAAMKTNYFQVVSNNLSETWWSAFAYAPPSAYADYTTPTRTHVTPHLLPDGHPYLPQPLWGGTSMPRWRFCVFPYNWLLYRDPTVAHINPPATYDQVATPAYRWIDETTYVSPRVMMRFGAPGTPAMFSGPTSFASGFDNWCRGYIVIGSNPPTHNVLPATYVFDPVKPGDPKYGIRYSLETERSTWTNSILTNKHVQTFRVVVYEPKAE